MILKNISKCTLLATVLSLYCAQSNAMEESPNPRRSPSSQLATSPVRSSSPTQFKIYLPSSKMEPHRSISQKDLTSLNGILEKEDECALRLNVRNSQGYTPLEHAIRKGFMDGVKALMAKGASPLITNEETWQNGFHIAALSGTDAMIRFLIVHSHFSDDHVGFQAARQKVIDTQKDERNDLLVSLAIELSKEHAFQVSLLVTQSDKQDKKPELLALGNDKLSPKVLDSTSIEKMYGEAIAKRYLAELVDSLD